MSVARFIFILEVMGTIAFAASGTISGIRKQLDLFGVIVMSVTTAIGGGVIRDIILGQTPPSAFNNPVYALIAVLCALFLFILLSFIHPSTGSRIVHTYEHAIGIMDSIGLGLFTVSGVDKAFGSGYEHNLFLLVFIGVLTGVGGGVLRDTMIQVTPFIFVKHIYASACIAGALFCALLMPRHETVAMVGGALLVILIRLLAARFQWNLPRITDTSV